MCALIRPGIWENLVISSKTKVNEGILELVIKSVESADAELAAFEGNSIGTSMESKIKMYPPNMTDYDTKDPKRPDEIGEDLRRSRFQLMEFGKIYASEEVCMSYFGSTKMFEGLGLAPEQYGQAIAQLVNEEWAKKVAANMYTKFVAFLVAANAYSGGVSFRMKFLRQSKDKNFAVIPNSDISIWIEPMTVPKANSKIEWTKWEIKNKKNDPNPSASSSAENTTATDVNAGANLFGGGGVATAPAALGTVAPPVGNPLSIAAINAGAVPPSTIPVVPVIAPPMVPVIPPVVTIPAPLVTEIPPIPAMPVTPTVPVVADPVPPAGAGFFADPNAPTP